MWQSERQEDNKKQQGKVKLACERITPRADRKAGKKEAKSSMGEGTDGWGQTGPYPYREE